MIIAKQKKAKLEEALLNPDLTAEVQQLRRNDVPEIPLVNESRDLMDRSREIQEKWKKQGEETQVLDKKATKANNKKVIVYMEAIPKKKAGDA